MMKSLIENECGGQNPLIKLTAHFTNSSEQKLTQDAIRNMKTNELRQADNFVSEYLGIDQKNSNINNNNSNLMLKRIPAPRTFQMEALLNELKQIDNSANMSISSNNLAAISIPATAAKLSTSSLFLNNNTTNTTNNSNEWSNEYWSSISAAFQKQSPLILGSDDRKFKWSAEYLTQTEATIFDEAWETMLMKNSNLTNSNLWLSSNDNITANISSGLTNTAAANTTVSATNQLNEEMRKTANELLDSMQDSRFSETEFLQFVRNLSTNGGSKSIDTNLTDFVVDNKNNIIELDETTTTLSNNDIASEWVKEFNNGVSNQTNTNTTSSNTNFWQDLQDEWNTAANSDPNHPWLDEFQKVFDTYKTYEFDKENPLQLHPNPFEEGMQRLKQHDIVNAVLLFEVAVQKEPDNMLAWQYLGTTQVENEQDAQAIRALRRCLDLKADNLIALSTLATCYTNESMQRLAFYSLIKWLKYHSDYSALLGNDEQAARLLQAATDADSHVEQSPFFMATLNVVHAGDFIDLQEVFLRAVRQSNKIDPDLQCCLGVLFHLSGEYDKAADCFKTALQIKPNDHLLWNKLGATFANSNRNEEAIDSYYQALKLCPGFVRARYNLGIGCMNLGAYKEAVEHFLTALVQQSQANLSGSETTNYQTLNKINNSQQMSETIWSTLRLALSYLNRSDLYSFCLSKDLEHLKQEFKI